MENSSTVLANLRNENPEVYLGALETIKAEGDLSIVPELLDILISTESEGLKKALTALLADIRDNGLQSLLTDKIREIQPDGQRALLLRIVWESSLDFSGYAGFFADILLEGEFAVALETSTILTELPNIGKQEKERIAGQLKAAPESPLTPLINDVIQAFTNA